MILAEKLPRKLWICPEQLQKFETVAKGIGEGLTHFIPATEIRPSTLEGNGRFALEAIADGALVGIIGGIFVSTPDKRMAVKVGRGIYIDQLFVDHSATVNHSCNPNLKLTGFNRLVAKRPLQIDDELTLDYGCICVGSGSIMIENCQCGYGNCRKVIKTDDYRRMDRSELGAYAHWAIDNPLL